MHNPHTTKTGVTIRIAAAALLFGVAVAPAGAMGPPGLQAPDGKGPHGYFFNMPAGKYVIVEEPSFVPLRGTGFRSLVESLAKGRTNASASDERVIGVVLEGKAHCLPIRQMTYHHIANVDLKMRYGVTYCALADSAVTFTAGNAPSDYKYMSRFDLLGSYGGTLIVEVTWPGCDAVPQIRPFAVIPSFQYEYRRAEVGPPCTITTLDRWMKSHPDTLVLEPDAKFESKYINYDYTPRGYQPSDARDKGLLQFDARLDPGHAMYGIAIGNEAACWTMEEIKKRGYQIVKLGAREVDVRWDDALDAPVIANATVPENLIATRCYWYAWANFYPESRVFGLEDARPEAGERANVAEWEVFE